jgi:hypothetical protein
MEPETEQDCWETFLPYHPDILQAITKIFSPIPNRTDQLKTNLFYACAMARVKYFRAPSVLPDSKDALGLANYHKTFYNTSGGATQVEASLPLFQQAIEVI